MLNNMVLIAGGAAGLIILAIAIYYLVFRVDRYTSVLCKPTHFKDTFNMFISNTKLPLSKKGNQFSYSLWINFQNVAESSQWYTNVNYKKPILYRFGSPNINYYPKDHKLQIQMAYKDKTGDIDYYNIDITTLPIQKWFNLIIVLDNRYVDVFIDGRRYITGHLPSVPFIFNRNLYLGETDNNFNGYVDRVKYFNYSLNEAEVANLQ